ncbi:ATP-binding cassette domain-containing protein [Halalkalibacter sp. APA_J-10(15)]|uniref:ABC transporter ATP-binding protein n=1 Tax=Halalkalibacter sp. APA_J-10(15) TaxID=2933805 RepID=UPI001FF37C72|nr:ATP-binding cassette domain-containing protein [Halalkalibacter sp. APA_J-10(15)]MCK0473037.1 ATP-binding cassette domain-containing protein [Halalkalibacter sp. APA_J-10(15)]
MIKVQELRKVYRQPIKKEGLKGVLLHYFKPKYVDKIAVDEINFEINEGESVAYLGKNGAGKSTTIKILTGILQPTMGKVLIDNIDPQRNRKDYNKTIGVVFGQRTQLWWDLPISESFKLIKEIYQIDDRTYEHNLTIFSELLDLNEFLHLSARKISLGQRMRADIAAALLHNPKILYLDEPTIGLDIVAKEKIRKFLRFINKEFKTTILLTTHDMGDIEELCDRLILIDSGKILYDGDLESVIKKYARLKKIQIRVENISKYEVLNGEFCNLGATLEALSEKEISVSFDYLEISASEVISLVMNYMTILDLKIEESGIEFILKQVYEGNLILEEGGE